MKSALFPILLIALASQCHAAGLTITPSNVPNGTVQTAYSATISASGGCAPYKWAVVDGQLPAGVTHKMTDQTKVLELEGTPTTAASYSFTVEVTGCGGKTVKESYTVVIQGGENHVVDLQWDASTSKQIAGYNVYRSPDGKTWKQLNASLVAATDYNDSTVANGSTYYYSATTVNTSGEQSSKSPSVEIKVPD
jgi:hypothetical protein